MHTLLASLWLAEVAAGVTSIIHIHTQLATLWLADRHRAIRAESALEVYESSESVNERTKQRPERGQSQELHQQLPLQLNLYFWSVRGAHCRLYHCLVWLVLGAVDLFRWISRKPFLGLWRPNCSGVLFPLHRRYYYRLAVSLVSFRQAKRLVTNNPISHIPASYNRADNGRNGILLIYHPLVLPLKLFKVEETYGFYACTIVPYERSHQHRSPKRLTYRT